MKVQIVPNVRRAANVSLSVEERSWENRSAAATKCPYLVPRTVATSTLPFHLDEKLDVVGPPTLIAERTAES